MATKLTVLIAATGAWPPQSVTTAFTKAGALTRPVESVATTPSTQVPLTLGLNEKSFTPKLTPAGKAPPAGASATHQR